MLPPHKPDDLILIKEAIQLARESAQKGFDPFGALLVKDNAIHARSIDKCIQYSDPTAHAELILISEFCKKEKRISLEGYSLYCNVEPCVMCSGAIHWSRISRVIFSVSQTLLQGISKGKQKPNCESMINIGNHKIEVVRDVLSEEGMKVLQEYPFSSKKEKHRKYYFP